MEVLRVLGGNVVGFVLAGGFYFLVLKFLLHVSGPGLMIASLVCGIIGGAYSGIAMWKRVYRFRPLSLLGYLLDMTWSLLNAAASLIVWLPCCMVAGGEYVPADEKSQRSGTFVYTKNPRGGGYDATTVGTVIGGGWSSHEEVHVWQARIFGPLYLPVYLTSLVLNIIFRLCTGKLDSLVEQAYFRVCFEDWAYAAGEGRGDTVYPGMWILWFLMCTLYVGFVLLILLGVFEGNLLISLAGVGGLVIYNLIRVFTPTTKEHSATAS